MHVNTRGRSHVFKLLEGVFGEGMQKLSGRFQALHLKLAELSVDDFASLLLCNLFLRNVN